MAQCSVIRDSKGEIQKVLAPNGKESILFNSIQQLGVDKETALKMYAQTQTPQFKEWFKDSKILDSNGEPLLMYHGSPSMDIQSFDPSLKGSRISKDNAGYFFTSNKDIANGYAIDERDPFGITGEEDVIGKTYPTFLKSSNLKTYEENTNTVENKYDKINQAINDGADAIKFETTDYRGEKYDEVIVFRPNQIKSVYNKGDYSQASNSIYYQIGENLDPDAITSKTQTILQKLSNRFNIGYSIVNNPNIKMRGWFVDDKRNGTSKVIVNLAHMLPDTAFHEYLHPFIAVLRQQNRALYDNLMEQMQNDQLGAEILAAVREGYTGLSDEGHLEEALVNYLGKLAEQKYNKPSSPFNRFMNWLKSLFKKIQIVDFKNLSLDMKLSEIADMIVDDVYVADLRAMMMDTNCLSTAQKPDTDLTYESVFDRIKDKVSILNATIRNRKKGDQFKEDIEMLNEIIKNQDEITSINNFVSNSIHYIDQAQRKFESLRASVKDPSKLSKDQLAFNLNILGEIQQLLNVYQSLDDVKSLLVREGKDSTDDSFAKLRDAIDKKELIIKDFKSFALTYLTEWLFPYIQMTNDNLVAEGKLEYVLPKEKFREQLVQALRDISAAGHWLGTTINSRDPVSAAIGLALKDVVYDNHVADLAIKNALTHEYQQARGTALYKSAKNEEEFNKQFLREALVWEKVGVDPDTGEERWDYVKRLAFHTEYFTDQYEKAKKDFYKQLGPRPPASDPVRLKAWKKAQGEWYSLNTVVNPAADNIIDQNRRTMSARQFEEWWLSNTKEIDNLDYGYGKTTMDYYGNRAVRNSYNPRTGTFRALSGELILPANKYRNSTFSTLMAKNPYYNKLYNTYYNANRQLGNYALKHGVIPQVSKGGNAFSDLEWKDGLKANVGKLLNKAVKSIEAVSDEDRTVQRQDDSEVKNIPIYYTRMLNSNDVSLDLLSTTLKYSQMANNYRGMTEIEPNIVVLKTVLNGDFNLGIKGREVAKTNAKGMQIFNAITKKVVPKMAREDMLDARLNEFINDVVYGDSEFDQTINILGKDLSVNKISNKTALITALQNMAANVNGGISNVAVGNFNNSIEAVGKRFYSLKDWGWAQKEYTSYLPSLIAETVGQGESFLNQLAEHYDVPQGEFQDHYGDNVSKGEFNKLMKTSTLFFLQKGGEHQIQTTAMLSLMKAKKLIGTDGKSISLYDALKETKGDMKQMQEKYGWTSQDDKMFRNRLHALVKNLHGVYNTFDKAMLSRRWYGKLALMFRKYLFKAIVSRYGAKYVDYELGTIDGGYWREFMAKMLHDMKEYKFGMLQRMWTKDGYNDFQKAAINKTLYEMAVIIAVMVTIGVVKGDDDKDKSWLNSELQLQLTRFSADITQYINPSDFIRVIRNPAASINMIEKWISWFQQLFHPFEQYDRAAGFAKKGDYKLYIKTLKLMPVVRQFINLLTPEEQLKFYNLTGR